MGFEIIGTKHLGPDFRSQPPGGTIAVTVREIDEMRDELTKSRAEVDTLTQLLRDSGTHVMNLSVGIAACIAERDELREDRDEYRDRYDHACGQRGEALVRAQELQAEIAELKRDHAWMTEATQ